MCWRETATILDFLRLLRARLARSKLGPLACRRPRIIGVQVPRLGGRVWLRSHSTDYGVLFEILGANAYRALDRVDHAQTILDLGANNGLVARWLLHRYPHARIVCVEPEPGNVDILRRNLAGFEHRAAVVAACIGDTERTVGLATTQGDWGYAMTDQPSGLTVPVVTMDRIIREHRLKRIDVMKCDIEGAEHEIFASARGWIGKIGFAVIECHDKHGEDLLPDGWEIVDRHGWWDRYGVETVAITPA